jgi:hypothetical protein
VALWACSPNGVRTRVSTLRVFSSLVALPAAMGIVVLQPPGKAIEEGTLFAPPFGTLPCSCWKGKDAFAMRGQRYRSDG